MSRPSGAVCAAATPIRPDLSIDTTKLARHCRFLLDYGCDGINLLGTTGEATSFGVAQRLEAMRAVAAAGLPLDRFLVGTGASALADAVELTRAARELGYAGALLLPPFYFKGIADAGLVTYVETLVGRVGAGGLRLCLYNFPQLTGVPWPVQVVETLRERFPEVVVGLKDSSGDFGYSRSLVEKLPGFAVYPSTEASLDAAAHPGYAGCISATLNITAPFASDALRAGQSAAGSKALNQAVAIRAALQSVPQVPAIKHALADLTGEDEWDRPHPPLHRLTPKEVERLRAALATTAYETLKGRLPKGR